MFNKKRFSALVLALFSCLALSSPQMKAEEPAFMDLPSKIFLYTIIIPLGTAAFTINVIGDGLKNVLEKAETILEPTANKIAEGFDALGNAIGNGIDAITGDK